MKGIILAGGSGTRPVSYTHLDVYKRQAVPIMFGIMGIAPNLVPWFLSEEFMASIPLVMMTAPIIVFIGISNVIGIQFLLPTRRQKAYTLSTIMGSIAVSYTHLKKMQYNLDYLRKFSFFYDLQLCFQTIIAVCKK